MKKILLFLILSSTLISMVVANGQSEAKPQTIVFADLSWDSAMVHNRIAAYIIENGLEGNYDTDFIASATIPTLLGMANGDIDVDMESYHSNFRDVYDEYISSGEILDLGKNLPDAPQGWYVPRYVLEGDKERGIEALAPNLKTTADLPEYWKVFSDPEDPEKGLIYLGISGWTITEQNVADFEEKGLDQYYNKGIPGSSAAVAATMEAAYRKGEGWIGYWWEPTSIMERLDMVMIPDTRFAPADVNILVNSDLTESAPDIVEFLKKYGTTVADNNEFLAKMEELDTDAQGAAEWFLINKENIWTQWVDKTVADRVRKALNS
ncbi:MAG: hypothetical protein PF518_04625 [Spirochaetaceae bacterium]|jgi:glycine betaine/proline transport system substrate-binding protein|nr:hypothetical protein [Spirochaetaceae bacterium]